MIEGQDGLNWERWKKLAYAVEDLGFAGLYRSDHFTNAEPPELDSLELWTSLTWLASHTSRIEFGPVVSPVSFRDPIFTARIAKDVDDLSGGRLTLGVGAGWTVREHEMFNYDLMEMSDRFDRFEEGLQVISGLLRQDGPVNFSGKYYGLKDAVLLPRPAIEGRPPLLIGGNGPNRTLRLAAQYADEWNGVFITPERFHELNTRLDQFLTERGREPQTVRRSVMTGYVYGRTPAELQERLDGRSENELRASGIVVGVSEELQAQIAAYANVGVQRLMLQWLYQDDLDGLEALAEALN